MPGYFCTDENNEKEFKSYRKVRDHCSDTGKFRILEKLLIVLAI